MKNEVTKDTTLSYEVPDVGYRLLITVPMTRDGYSRLAEALRRNVSVAIATMDDPHFQRFMRDWSSAVQVFEKAGCLTKEEAADEISRIKAYPREVISYAVDKVLQGVEAVITPAPGKSVSWKKILALGLAAGGAYYVLSGRGET
jgi:hypothetical protein